MADLIELAFAKDDETMVRKDTQRRVDAKPIGEPVDLFWRGYASDWKKRVNGELRSQSQILPKNANAYVLGRRPGEVFNRGGPDVVWVTAQFYKIYQPSCFRELYGAITARIKQHPEVELIGTAVDGRPFADINLHLYVAPYQQVHDPKKLNAILSELIPDNAKPIKAIDARVDYDNKDTLHVGLLEFQVEIGEKRELNPLLMTSEDLLTAIDNNNVIEKGAYTAGLLLWIVPDKKLVYQNINEVWVVEKHSWSLQELERLSEINH